MAPQVRDPKTREKTAKLENYQNEPVGIGGRPPTSIWINVQAKERRNVELERIITHSLGDGVQPIMEWEKLLMGSYKVLFLQVQPNFVAHLKLMWHPVLIMALACTCHWTSVGYPKPIGGCVGSSQ
jgi:hypothetical protein